MGDKTNLGNDVCNSRPCAPDEAHEFASLAEDWATIWRSELSAMAVDRELADMPGAHLAAWASLATLLADGLTAGRRAAAGPAGTAAPPGSQAVAAAPDARDDAIRALAGRVERLERRLAELERR